MSGFDDEEVGWMWWFAFLALVVWALSVVLGSAQSYNRAEWTHWVDEDGDCLTTRHEVLASESLIAPTITDCRVVGGLWRDPYTDHLHANPSDLDIDHVVSLYEAHVSGGDLWSADKKRRYANDLQNPQHLVATAASINRGKGAADPSRWVPDVDVCGYISRWVDIKARYRLAYDAEESAAIVRYLGKCPR